MVDRCDTKHKLPRLQGHVAVRYIPAVTTESASCLSCVCPNRSLQNTLTLSGAIETRSPSTPQNNVRKPDAVARAASGELTSNAWSLKPSSGTSIGVSTPVGIWHALTAAHSARQKVMWPLMLSCRSHCVQVSTTCIEQVLRAGSKNNVQNVHALRRAHGVRQWIHAVER